MIKISGLNKIYKSKKTKKFQALKNINLTLPDNGLIFILGKSGSGKSTLLNLIGGLDSISSGSIVVDGNDLSTFKEKDFCSYRNTHIGFIFQDYHLIEELTVYENIVLSLDLNRKKDYKNVSAALEKVDLAGYENRYPRELSGGEQQRVAIARAIVKNPRIILADEPTGNLDSNTSVAILKLLKKLSRECLILIVSHNIGDASNYADRIIELRHGEIIEDRTKNPDFLDKVTLFNGVLFYPQDMPLSNNDISLINQSCNKPAMLMKRTDKFLPTKKVSGENKKITVKKKSFSFKKEMSLSAKFLKNKTVSIALSAFMVSVIMVIMSLSQTITAFNSGGVIVNEMKNNSQSSMILTKDMEENAKNQLSEDFRVSIDKSESDVFYEGGYGGEIYPLLNYSIPIKTFYTVTGKATKFISNSIFINETLGTLVVNDGFLKDKFGDFSYAARRSEFHPLGVVITDYVADAILATCKDYSGRDYGYIIENGIVSSKWPSESFIINGIIDTGYKDKYASLLERIKSGSLKMDSSLFTDDEASNFLSHVYDRLGLCYSLNPSFLEDYKASASRYYTPYQKLVFADVVTYTAGSNMVVIANNGTKIMESDSVANWRYTVTAPTIPEGAKYIRVCYNPAIEKYYYDEDAAYKKGYATLRFEGYEAVGEEVMNLGKNQTLTCTGAFSDNINNRYLSDYILIPDNAKIAEFCAVAVKSAPYCAFYNENKELIGTVKANDVVMDRENSIVMSYSVYNELFGTEYTANNLNCFVPHEIKLSHYMKYDVNNENPLFEKTVYVSGLTTSVFYVSEDLFRDFYADSVFAYGLYFNGTDEIDGVISVASDKGYSYQSSIIDGIHSMTRAVDVFVPIFELISVFLYVGVIFILVSFSSKMINDKMHDIGILKALGTKNKTVFSIFGLQVGLIVFLTCIMSTVGYYLFIDVANDVLVDSIRTIAPTWIIFDLQFLTYDPFIAFVNCVLVIILAAASLIIPMIKIKAIKPVQIIKAKE